ncbi:MAG: hypothetical protein LBG76_00295 [Treponema sp.]|jgi:hypothetical protein|nr:hypothetical protein [Treponema sp.]
MDYPHTGVTFSAGDDFLQKLFDAAEAVCRGNVKDCRGRPVLIEGGGYNSIYLETQPMGGEMYAKRNLTAAMNNVLVFIEYQLRNGRYPGVVDWRNEQFAPRYGQFQGFCFPRPALNLYYWNKKRDREYLERLAGSLEAWDGYLWKYRDSDGDGCLESWTPVDTGEDHSGRFHGASVVGLEAPGWYWPGEKAPEGDPVFPIESMDVMSYSHDARMTLARLSALLDDGREAEWRAKARAVRAKIRSSLWDEGRGACFDRDSANRTMPTLTHNNLRCMYFGSFEPDMAERFVREHLFNPAEFFTPFPLPSIAVNDPCFRNASENNWSGQSEGLTWQRAIRALENYGFYAELTILGEKLINNVGRRNTFPQQFDPFTGEFSEADKRADYGPTALSVLEYMSRFWGVHLQGDELWWGCLGLSGRKGGEAVYTQQWDGAEYTLHTGGGRCRGSINGKEIFSVSEGARLVTGWEGGIKKIINMTDSPLEVELHSPAGAQNCTLERNGVYGGG